jgi:hypothetical protein
MCVTDKNPQNFPLVNDHGSGDMADSSSPAMNPLRQRSVRARAEELRPICSLASSSPGPVACDQGELYPRRPWRRGGSSGVGGWVQRRRKVLFGGGAPAVGAPLWDVGGGVAALILESGGLPCGALGHGSSRVRGGQREQARGGAAAAAARGGVVAAMVGIGGGCL